MQNLWCNRWRYNGIWKCIGIAFANQELTIPVYAQAEQDFILFNRMFIAFSGSAILTYIVGFNDIEEKMVNIDTRGK